jgi:PKD repeat protein
MIVFRHGILLTLILLVGFSTVGWSQTTDVNATTGEGFFLIRQGDLTQPLVPIRQSGSAVTFYAFQNDQSNTQMEIPEHSLLALHVDELTGNVSLVIIMSSALNPSGGSANFSFDGLPLGATIAIQDDFTDTFSFTPPTAQMGWTWLPEHSDGVVISNLGTDFQITITPNFGSGINTWDYIDGTNRIPNPLPSLVEPITIVGTLNAPPVAHFNVTSEVVSLNVGVVFDASSSNDDDGSIVEYEWDFNNDGLFEISTARPTVQHVFTEGGTTTVTLRVTDDTGGFATYSQTFVVTDEVVSAMRTISTPMALPGLAFRVTIDLTMRADINGLGVDENLPVGWEVTPIDNAGATFKRSENQWVFPSILRAGEVRRIVYDVVIRSDNVGAGPLPVALQFSGTVDSAAPAFRSPVLGESDLQVTTCLTIPVAMAHLNPNTDVVDLRSNESISFDQVQRAVTFWIESIGVPHTCNALVDVEVLKELSAREMLNVPVDENIDLLAFDGANPTVTRTILAPLPFYQLYLPARGGNAFRVEILIEADQDYNGFAFGESLPRTWTIRPIDNNGAAYNPRAREWVFTSRILSGETRTVIYEVVVPEGESSGTFTVTGTASSAAPLVQTSIANNELVEIVECLAVPVAIAHMNTDTETIDITLSNQISFDQVQVAIAFWLEDQEVVGTCGMTIDFDQIKQLIAFWLTDTPIDQGLLAIPTAADDDDDDF